LTFLRSHRPRLLLSLSRPAYFDITKAPSWSGALFDGKIRIPTRGLSSVTPELSAVLVHELTHALFDRYLDAVVHLGLMKGRPVSGGQVGVKPRKWLDTLNKERQLIPLMELQGSFVGLPADAASLAYHEGLAAVEFLVASAGRTAIRKILDLMGQNYNFETAFQNALNKSVEKFDAEWRGSLSR